MNKLNNNLSDILDIEPVIEKKELIVIDDKENIDDDAEFARQNIRGLIEKGNEAIDGIFTFSESLRDINIHI